MKIQLRVKDNEEVANNIDILRENKQCLNLKSNNLQIKNILRYNSPNDQTFVRFLCNRALCIRDWKIMTSNVLYVNKDRHSIIILWNAKF